MYELCLSMCAVSSISLKRASKEQAVEGLSTEFELPRALSMQGRYLCVSDLVEGWRPAVQPQHLYHWRASSLILFARQRMTNSKSRLVVPKLRSKKIPPRKGLKNLSMIASEKPSAW